MISRFQSNCFFSIWLTCSVKHVFSVAFMDKLLDFRYLFPVFFNPIEEYLAIILSEKMNAMILYFFCQVRPLYLHLCDQIIIISEIGNQVC